MKIKSSFEKYPIYNTFFFEVNGYILTKHFPVTDLKSIFTHHKFKKNSLSYARKENLFSLYKNIVRLYRITQLYS